MTAVTITSEDLTWFNTMMSETYADSLVALETPAAMRARVMRSGKSKARRAEQILITPANAFNDYGHYDAEGEPLLRNQYGEVTGTLVTEMDDRTNDWVEFGTQTEQRLASRGDAPNAEVAIKRAGKGDPVTFGNERAAYDLEKVYGNLPGYHPVYRTLRGVEVHPDGYQGPACGCAGYNHESCAYVPIYWTRTELDRGTIVCWYCATTFSAYRIGHNHDRNEPSRNLMQHFIVEAILHNYECKAKHIGLPLLRMIGYDGKPRLQRAAWTWGKPSKKSTPVKDAWSSNQKSEPTYVEGLIERCNRARANGGSLYCDHAV